MNTAIHRIIALLLPFVTALTAAAQADTITLSSPLIPEPMRVTVARPDGPGPFPTLYLLNGHGGNYRNWPGLIDIDSLARTREWVVVCPSGMNSWYWDAPEEPEMKMESFFVEELVPAIDSLYPTIPSRESRAITGLSMGGHGALWLALRHPSIWANAGSTSGGVDIRPFPGSWNMKRWIGERDSFPDRWRDHTVRNLVETLPDSVLTSVNITIDCGTSDFFYEVNCQLDSILSARRIPHSFATYPGRHDWRYWRGSIHPQLERFARAFDAALLPTRRRE
ncbi:MAG: esterase family protein [Pseudoflavonifractor sp.]|nr:esterase family protein [Alloprevotella sp.]MCM1117569.1 esterase family protein [Pseudoflavonifractor sp.]